MSLLPMTLFTLSTAIQARWRVASVGGKIEQGSAVVASVPVSTLSARHELALPVFDQPIVRLGVELDLAVDRAWSLSPDRVLEPVDSLTTPPSPVGRFLVVERGGRLRRLELPWAARLQLEPRHGGLLVRADLFDVGACGLSRARPLAIVPVAPRTLDVFEDSLDSLDDCLWIEPFPGGARGALCITDHPDFDSVEKLKVLGDLFGRLDLRFTKGVFPAREPLGHKQEPGVDVPEYRALVEELFAKGNEIAFHGIGPRARSPEIEEFRRRLDNMRAFSPSTWIDHGSGDYLFSRRARLHGGESLVDLLGSVGIVNYWSYVDTWSNPFVDLRSDAVRSHTEALHDFVRGMAAASSSARGLKGWLYPASSFAHNLVGETGALGLRRRPLRPKSWRIAVASRRAHRIGNAGPMPLYGLDGAGFALTSSPTWVFDTVLISHPAFQLTPDAIDRLCADSGLSLIHCYLSCTHSYISGGCFTPGRADTLHPRFVENMEYIADRQRAGDLSVLPLSDLRAALTAFRRTRLERVAEGWRFEAGSAGANVVVGGSPSALARLRCDPARRFGGWRPRLGVTADSGLLLSL